MLFNYFEYISNANKDLFEARLMAYYFEERLFCFKTVYCKLADRCDHQTLTTLNKHCVCVGCVGKLKFSDCTDFAGFLA